jgi:hypothetical protein
MINNYSAQPILQASLKLKSFGSDLRMPMDVVCEGEKYAQRICKNLEFSLFDQVFSFDLKSLKMLN